MNIPAAIAQHGHRPQGHEPPYIHDIASAADLKSYHSPSSLGNFTSKSGTRIIELPLPLMLPQFVSKVRNGDQFRKPARVSLDFLQGGHTCAVKRFADLGRGTPADGHLWHRVPRPSSRRLSRRSRALSGAPCALSRHPNPVKTEYGTRLGVFRCDVAPIRAEARRRHDVGEGRLSAFRRDVEAAIPALRRYARALTRDTDAADDLVQDTLVRALRSEHLFHGGDIRSWLYTILTNLNRNRLRSLARRPALSPIEDNDAPDLAGPEAGGRDIERALGTLVEDQRNALLLVVLEGLSYREVAEVQGVPIGTVMSRLARARVQIKSYLDGERPALRRVK